MTVTDIAGVVDESTIGAVSSAPEEPRLPTAAERLNLLLLLLDRFREDGDESAVTTHPELLVPWTPVPVVLDPYTPGFGRERDAGDASAIRAGEIPSEPRSPAINL